MDDFSVVIQTLTEGLRDLPTDDAARVKHFLTEYLGEPRHPVPFGGRERDFERLDDWLAGRQATPYALLAAPAGRGKSALLLRWCQRLLARPDLAVVYFPVSIRFRTNLAGVVFPALVALLARLHGETLPSDPHTREEVWRSLLTAYMTRPLPDGRKLLLVLDGVDEAADWTAGPDLFPTEPPPGLRVVLSARYLANDQDARAWLKRLGWTAQGLACAFELYPLDRSGIASVLVQMGFPVDLLGTRVDIISELHRLSEGDPLLIRLYVDDLWERGEAEVRRLRPEDLRTMRPGLVGYFERWWNDQRLLWSKDAPAREAATSTVLKLLAGALGPLSQADILSLAPAEAGLQATNLEQHLEPLARFVIGDGMRQGYVFSHPRLANYFLEERLNPAEREEVEQRFLAWGARTLAALNAGEMLPEQASAYIVQYYGAHMERAEADAPAVLALVSDGWRRAWEKLDRANAGFLGDGERAWRAAEREDAQACASGQQAPYLGAEIRSLLCRVSINSMTSNISPRLMREAVQTGIWTPAQGLACIRLIADLAPRARELVALAPAIQEPLCTDILQEALDTIASIKDEHARLDALVELAPAFPRELLEQILETVRAIADEADRAGVLAELAPALMPYPVLVEKALDLVQEIAEEEYIALALAGLAPCFSTEQQGSVLQLARNIQDERYRAQTLLALVPHLPATLCQDVLQETRQMWDSLFRARLLAELMYHLPEQLRSEALQEALDLLGDLIDQDYRVEVLVKLAPCLPEDRLRQALSEAQELWDESDRARALNDLLPFLPQEQLTEFLLAVRAIRNEEQRAAVLLRLFPRLPEVLLAQTLDIVQAIWDEGLRAELLAKLVPMLKEAWLPRSLEFIQAIKDPGYRVWLLAELEIALAGKWESLPFDIVQVFQSMKDAEERLQTLLAILPRLSEQALAKIFAFMLPEIFDFRWAVQSADRRAQILTKLGPRLPAPWLLQAITMVRHIGDELSQAEVLIALAPRIQETLLPEALDLVRAMKNRQRRAQVLEALISALPQEQRGERVREMLQVLQVIKDERDCAYTASRFAATLQSPFPPDRLPVVLDALETLHSESHRASVLLALAPHVPESGFDEVLLLVRAMRSEETRARILEILAPRVPERSLSAFLAAVRALPHERWQAPVLAQLVAHASKATFTRVLGLVRGIQDENERTRVLAAVAPHTPEGAFAYVWSAIQRIADQGPRAWVLGTLALRVPEEFFPQLWTAIRQIEDEGWQMRILTTLAPHMSEDFFALLWAAIQQVREKKWQARAISTLAPYVPERFFPDVFLAAQALPLQETRTKAPQAELPDPLEALAAQVPESFFPTFWEIVSNLQAQWRRARLQTALAGRVPESFFPDVWETACAMEDTWDRAEMLEALAPRVPREFFRAFLGVLNELQGQINHISILKALIPRLSAEQLADVLEITLALPEQKGRIEVVEALIPHLSAEQCAAFLHIPFASWSADERVERLIAIKEAWPQGWWERILAALVPRLPEEVLRAILPAVLQVMQERVKFDETRCWLLTKLAVRVPEEVLPEMLEALWSFDDEQHRAQVLTALLPGLSQAGRAKALELMLARTREAEGAHFLLRALANTGPAVQQAPPALLYPVLRDLLHSLASSTRREAVLNLAPLAPVVCILGGEEAAAAVCCALLEVGSWWP
ncbi:MAG TPA: ATP-binding protein [Ktedonobacteraceae bacterium]|nr:ATP-binding protein [Ktedonobacteraceae bacterium]